MNINGKFKKVAETNSSVIIGTLGDLKETTHKHIVEIASFYNINSDPDKFNYHCTTPEGAAKSGCKLLASNYNEFVEIFK